MPSFKTKAGIGAGVISSGALGGMGYGIYTLTNTSDSLKNYLLKNELTPIEEDDSEEWDDIFESYKLEKTSATQIQNKEVTSSEEIKNWCISSLNKNISSIEDPLFKKASKWCVEIMNIEKSLGGSNAFEEVATKLASKYSGLKKEVKDSINAGEAESVDNNTIGTRIKKWCDTNKKRRASDDEKEFFFYNIEKICLKSGDS